MKFTELFERANEIMVMYEHGATYKQIMEKLNIKSRMTVWRYLKVMRVKTRKEVKNENKNT